MIGAMASEEFERCYCATCREHFEVSTTKGSSLYPRCPKGHAGVHVDKCVVCAAPVGQVTDDDYCSPTQLVCPACMASKPAPARRPPMYWEGADYVPIADPSLPEVYVSRDCPIRTIRSSTGAIAEDEREGPPFPDPFLVLRTELHASSPEDGAECVRKALARLFEESPTRYAKITIEAYTEKPWP
jgi:hypothetical protein